MRMQAQPLIAVCTALLLVGCTSAGAGNGQAAKPSSTAAILRNVALTSGTYKWQLPLVTVGSEPGSRPVISAGHGPDPITGFTAATLRDGTGPRISDVSQLRIRWVSQSWDGKHTAHDSWSQSDSVEPVPDGDLGLKIQVLAIDGHVGDVYELVRPVSSGSAVNGQSAIIALELVSA